MATSSIYISFSSRDRYWARTLHRALDHAGIMAVFDETVLRLGQPWKPLLDAELEQSTVLVLLVSENSQQSPNVRHEVEMARRLGKAIAPVMLDNSWDALETFGLRDIHARSLASPDDLNVIIRDLRELLEPGLTEMLLTMRRKGADPDEIAVMRHLTTHPNHDDLILYYDDTLGLETMLRVQRAVNLVAWDIIRNHTIFRRKLRPEVNYTSDIFEIISYTRPASDQDIFRVIEGVLQNFFASPVPYDLLIESVGGAFSSLIITTGALLGRRVFTATKNERWDTNYPLPDLEQLIEPDHRDEIIQTVITTEKTIGIRGLSIVSVTKQTTEQRTLRL